MIGLLPQEEAAINRALHESLLQEKRKTKHKLPALGHTSEAHSSSSALCSEADQSCTSTSAVAESNAYSSRLEASSDAKSSKRLHSPLSPSRSLDSSSESKSSSPLRGGGTVNPSRTFRGNSSSSMSSPRSVESSLKLILSTSSWSRSSSSSWSPTPEPVGGSSAGKMSQHPTTAHSQLLSKLKTVRVTGTKGKGKRGRPRKYPLKDVSGKSPSKHDKMKGRCTAPSKVGKIPPKTYTKAALQIHSALLSKKKKKQTKASPKSSSKPKGKRGHGSRGAEEPSELDIPPLSPEAALVLHDHCYMGGVKQDIENKTATSVNGKCNIRPRYV